MLPSILGPIFYGEEKTPWKLQRIGKAWVEPQDREVRRLFHPILECLIWSCAKGRNEYTSATETDMSVVTLPSQKLKAWQKLQLERTIGKWPEAHRVAEPQINVGSTLAAAASSSVSQAKRFFVQGANTAMKMNGSISGDLETGRKKITARQ